MSIQKICSLLVASTLLSSCTTQNNISKRCALVPDAGLCKAYIVKYYYDPQSKRCKEFVWGGCGGVVPFDSLIQCQKDCGCR